MRTAVWNEWTLMTSYGDAMSSADVPVPAPVPLMEVLAPEIGPDPFQCWIGDDGQWYWHIKSPGNHEVLSHSEGYTTYSACLEGIAAVRRAVLAAGLRDA